MTVVMLNGSIQPADRAVVPALDRGLTHGLGLYETLKILDGVPVFFDEHLARLRKGLATLRIELPESSADLAHQVVRLSEAAAIPDGACRVLVTAGPPHGRPTLLIQIEVREFPAHPLRLISYRALRSAADLKSKSFTTSHLALQAAQKAGADDALFVDQEGQAHEATTANLFAEIDGTLVTPPLDGSILPGVIRTKLVELCGAAGRSVAECHVVAADLGENDSLLLSSSVRGVVAAQSLDGRKLRLDDELLSWMRSLLCSAEAASAQHFRQLYC